MRFHEACRFLLLSTLACAARIAPYNAGAAEPLWANEADYQEPAHVLRFLRIGGVLVQLDSSATLRSLHLDLGFASAPSIRRSGEYVQVCYRLSGQPGTSLLVRSWDLGGPRMTVLGFQLSDGSTPPADQACEQLDVPRPSVTTDRGLQLGLDSAEVARILGVPDSVRGPRQYYMKLVSTPDGIDELSSLTVELVGGRVKGIEGAFVRTR